MTGSTLIRLLYMQEIVISCTESFISQILKVVAPLGESSIFSFAWELNFLGLITKPKKLKDKNLIHDRETPAIFKFSAKNFDTYFNSTRQSEHLLMNKF